MFMKEQLLKINLLLIGVIPKILDWRILLRHLLMVILLGALNLSGKINRLWSSFSIKKVPKDIIRVGSGNFSIFWPTNLHQIWPDEIKELENHENWYQNLHETLEFYKQQSILNLCVGAPIGGRPPVTLTKVLNDFLFYWLSRDRYFWLQRRSQNSHFLTQKLRRLKKSMISQLWYAEILSR